jgi:uncharacterized protein (DUF488 family)
MAWQGGGDDCVASNRTVMCSVGHGTLSASALAELLEGAGVAHVVDIRSFPGSRRNPQYHRDQLERWLPEAGITYSWDPRLGGRRPLRPGSPNVALRHQAFRAYADHMATEEFRTGLDSLVELAATNRVVMMCAESVWWRCHRRLLADALVLLRDVDVWHLFHDGRVAPHSVTPAARRVRDQLVYDVGHTASLLPD